jgi:1-acyl-sn-glycerol-3-phosphate acyltransferase
MKKIITTPFDRQRMPPKQNLFFMPLIWLCCWFATRQSRLKITKIGMKGLKPPFLVLGSHHAFMDFFITPLALFPHRANYVSELEGFEAFGEWLYRQAGCLGTRRFVDDLALIKNIERVIKRKGILVLYPEARYANVGTNSTLSASVGKLAKRLKVPVVIINMHGNYLQSPIWNLTMRKEVRLEAEIIQLFTRERLAASPLEEVQEAIRRSLCYDEYAWQFEKGMRISYPKRAEGLELVLYKCPCCLSEFEMASKLAGLYCRRCGSIWHMSDLGKLDKEPGSDSTESLGTKNIHIPAWYEWQRAEVIKEIDSGAYALELTVHIESLPNAKNFIDLGEGQLKHSEEGFALNFTDYGEKTAKTLFVKPLLMGSVHTEYDYRGKGQCITLSTLDNTYFLFPRSKGFNATKIQFAVEYLYERTRAKARIL